MCTYASTYTSSICNNIVRAEFKNLFQIMLKKWSEFSIVTFLYYSPLFVFFPPKPFIINNSSLNGLEASGVSISSAESSVVYILSLWFYHLPTCVSAFPLL